MSPLSSKTQDPDWCAKVGQAGVGNDPRVIVIAAPGRQTVWWVIAVLLAVIATAVVLHWDEARLMKAAMAQTDGGPVSSLRGARGIYAFSGQLTARSYGLFMLDVDSGTVWCYELDRGANDELQLRLVTARSWIWDRYLEEFNVTEPIPSAVRVMVQQQRAVRESGSSSPVTPDEGRESMNLPTLPGE